MPGHGSVGGKGPLEGRNKDFLPRREAGLNRARKIISRSALVCPVGAHASFLPVFPPTATVGRLHVRDWRAALPEASSMTTRPLR